MTTADVSDDELSTGTLGALSYGRDSRITLLSVVSTDIPSEEQSTTSHGESTETSTPSIILSPLNFKEFSLAADTVLEEPEGAESPTLPDPANPETHGQDPSSVSKPIASDPSAPSITSTFAAHGRSRSESRSSSATSHTPLTRRSSRASSASSLAAFGDLITRPEPLNSVTPRAAPLDLPSTPSPAPSELPHLDPSDFRVRRLRAAKLSRFFGVGLNDLASVLPAPPVPSGSRPTSPIVRPSNLHDRSAVAFAPAPSLSTDSPPLTHPTSQQPQNQSHKGVEHPQASRKSTAQGSSRVSTSVEVAAEVKHTFGFGNRNVKQMDMEAAIHQLRRMR